VDILDTTRDAPAKLRSQTSWMERHFCPHTNNDSTIICRDSTPCPAQDMLPPAVESPHTNEASNLSIIALPVKPFATKFLERLLS